MIFTGIQPSGIVTLGNYLGAIKNWTKAPDSTESLYCIVDLHALTSKVSPQELNSNIKFLSSLYIALGLHQKGKIFIQSDVKEHTELAWFLQTKTNLGDLERMTQFKDKSQNNERPNSALLTYPVLMAADILLYDTTVVPVGHDQKQHLELTRNIAQKLNFHFEKELFVVPEPKILEVGSKIYSLTEPTKKMSKSDPNPKSYISIMDEPKVILKKIKSSKTDSLNEINLDKENQPGVYNLLQIYAAIKEISLDSALEFFKGNNYGFLKETVANSIIEELVPLQNEIKKILKSPEEINSVLSQGKDYAQNLASKKILEVKETFGLYQY